MNRQLLEMNTLILSLGERLRLVSKSLAQATGNQQELLTAERDELLNQYTHLCSKAATMIA